MNFSGFQVIVLLTVLFNGINDLLTDMAIFFAVFELKGLLIINLSLSSIENSQFVPLCSKTKISSIDGESGVLESNVLFKRLN